MGSDPNVDGEALLADVIGNWVFAESDLLDEAKFVVLAALEGDESLFTELNGGRGPGAAPVLPSAGDTRDRPAGAFLKSISVRGFRGIGPQARLDLRPGPGLTIVAGRNGSGKSSFADALELALTGETYRWRSKNSKIWSEHWRNVHDGAPCSIRVELAHEGVGVTTVGVDWADDDALPDRKVWVQRQGKQRESGKSGLGWDRALELYQPILSYDELGGVLDQGPSKLFDKIDAILGIEQATDAEKRLAAALKQLQEPGKDAKGRLRDLKKALATLPDERAAQAHDLLRKRIPALDAIEAIATGTTREPVAELAQLKVLAQLTAPPRTDIVAAAGTLRTTANALAEVGEAVVVKAKRRVQLLRQALTFHEHHGDGACPVCGKGVLDSAWRTNVEAEIGKDDNIERYASLTHQLAQARESALSLIRSVRLPVQPDRITLESFRGALQTVQSWLNVPERDDELAVHLESVHTELDAALALLRQEAEAVLRQHEDDWTPHATSLAAWVGIARKAREAEPQTEVVESALAFVRLAVERLRDRELAALTSTARDIWAALKQESNVNLGRIELKGTSTRRRVELRADVDGAEAQALGVMSQGELHALALALFLPRATMPGSPFRFVVLDDPIQAMDPAKVDGFVDVLARLAAQRQVVVFSHDDRLTQAVRESQVPAEILEVCRLANSSVEISRSLDPAGRYIDDAFAIASDKKVPPDIAIRIIPGLCRMAVEELTLDIHRTRCLTAGGRRTEVEAAWHDTKTMRQRVALAVYGDKSAELTGWIERKPWRRRALEVVTSRVHTGLRGMPVDAVRDVENLVRDLREVLGAR